MSMDNPTLVQRIITYNAQQRASTPQTPPTPVPDDPTPIPDTTPPATLFLATPTLAPPTALNVRAAPNGMIIDTVKPGETVKVIAPTNARALVGVQNQWLQVITAKGTTGVCAAWLVKVVEPPTEPHAWQKELTPEQRSIYSRAKAGELARIDETMVRMGELLDEAHALIATLQARKP